MKGGFYLIRFYSRVKNHLVAGVTHFTKSHLYERIIPPYVPAHKTVVLASGIVEMILGLMLLSNETQTMASWGIIGILILFFPVHIYMLQEEKAAFKQVFIPLN